MSLLIHFHTCPKCRATYWCWHGWNLGWSMSVWRMCKWCKAHQRGGRMSRSTSPSSHWSSAHGGARRPGRERKAKVVHRWKFTAWWHAVRLNWKRRRTNFQWEVYPCKWGNDYRDGQTAKLHYHVGRRGRRAERWELKK